MFQRQRNWISDVLWKPKKVHSLEQLRYLDYVLTKNSVVNETNRGLLVETLRSIAEILIWGDQNDSRVFDFFLEKNMLLYFLKMMSQKSNQICIQLLQTLSILFENIRNETSLYYLLSNNHVNSIIIHKFDFSDEEVLAYYISFLKTLSLKLNNQTIHFFFNEHKNDFPLYTEALKFFNHSESMVRIAVRTLTLNVYRVGNRSMLSFIRHKTADPYFWNLVWFIGNHAIELNTCALKESDHLHCDRLKDLVAEHLDHLHYVHDILCLQIKDINYILVEHLLNRLLIPLYIYSLIKKHDIVQDDVPRISVAVALFLLSQIFLIMKQPALVSSLMDIILNGDETAPGESPEDSPLPLHKGDPRTGSTASVRKFIEPELTLEESLVAQGVNTEGYTFLGKTSVTLTRERSVHVANSKFYVKEKAVEDKKSRKRASAQRTHHAKLNGTTVPLGDTPLGDVENEEDSSASIGEGAGLEDTNDRPWRAQRQMATETTADTHEEISVGSVVRRTKDFSPDRRFFKALLLNLDCSDSDEEGLFVLCLLYASLRNEGVDKRLLEEVGIPSEESDVPYNDGLVLVLIKLLEQGCRNGSKVRAVTLEMCIVLLKELVLSDSEPQQRSHLKDEHLALVQNVREACTLQLRYYYKEDDIFLDMFEDEYRQLKTKPLNVERLLMDATLLLPVTGTPLTGIEFSKRLPCGEVEHTRRAIRVFLLMRDFCLSLLEQLETSLPLSRVENSVHLEDVLDLNNSDLIACTLKIDEKCLRRFLVIDEAQFILVEPDTTKLGWGVVKFVARLQDVETMPDKEDSRSLFITIHQPSAGRSLTKVRARPILSAKFVFDDYIRCMSARQRLQRRSTMLRQHKLRCIAQLLELPAMAVPPSHYYSITPPAYINMGQTHDTSPRRSSVETAAEAPPGDLGRERQPGGTGARTTSQAQALANVLEHCDSPPNEPESNPEDADRAFGIKARALSVEEAFEAIELERKRTVTGSRAESKASSSDSETPYHSAENIARRPFTPRTGSCSAPPTPRGNRYPAPVVPSEQNADGLTAQNFMSEPTIFFRHDWNETMPEADQHLVKKTKKTANRKGGRVGNSRQKRR